VSAAQLAALLVGIPLGLSAIMAVAWWVAMKTERSGFVDGIWSLCTATGGVVAALGGGPLTTRALIVAAMAAFWGLRLGAYLMNRAAESEDPRYAALKRQWGDQASRRLFVFLQVQAVAALPLVLTMGLAARAPRAGLDWRDYIGLALFALAWLGEAVADRQMRTFRSLPENRGGICRIGLWNWSRHPNYFSEWLVWLSFAVIAVGGWGWIAVIGPVTMYWLLVHASGIPPLEAHLARSRPEAFARYAAEVSAFWPRPPRSSD